MSGNKAAYETFCDEYELTERSDEVLACEWDNYLNDGFDIFSVNNGLSLCEIVLEKNHLGNSVGVNEINIDNVMNFSFQNETERNEQQQKCDDEQIEKDKENMRYSKDDIKEEVNNINNKIFNGFLNRGMNKACDDGDEDEDGDKDEVNLDINENEREEVNKSDIEDKVICDNNNEMIITKKQTNYEEDKNNVIQESNNKNRFFLNTMLICNSITSLDILRPITLFSNTESQTDLIVLKQSTNQVNISFFTIQGTSWTLSSHTQESFCYFSIPNNKGNAFQIATNEILFTIPCIPNQEYQRPSKQFYTDKKSKIRFNDFNIRYDNEENLTNISNSQHNIIQTVNWFSVENNCYCNYLRKDYKDDQISISNEISVCLSQGKIKPITNDNDNKKRKSKHLSDLISEDTFYLAKAQSVHLLFEQIEDGHLNKDNTHNNDDQISKDAEITQLNKQLSSFKYQNKLLTDENKKLIEVINIFKMLSSIEKNENGNANGNAYSTTKVNKTITLGPQSNEKGIDNIETKKKIDINNNTLSHNNKKRDTLDEIENRLSNYSNNQCIIPLQLKSLNNNPNIGHDKDIEENSNKNSLIQNKLFNHSNSHQYIKPKDKRKKIVQQLEFILDNVKYNDEPKVISQTLNNTNTNINTNSTNKLVSHSLPMLNTDFNKKTTTDSSSKNVVVNSNTNTNINPNNNNNNKNDRIPFHLISQRKLYENLIKSISNNKETNKML